MSTPYKTADDIFICQQCGQCCKGYGGTYVSLDHINTIAGFIGVTPEAFIQQYCDQSGERYVLTRGKDGFCIFFDHEKQCTIHGVKPYMCRAWPFIQSVIDFPENWNIMAGACPGMKKDIPHQALVTIVKKEKEKLDKK